MEKRGDGSCEELELGCCSRRLLATILGSKRLRPPGYLVMVWPLEARRPGSRR